MSMPPAIRRVVTGHDGDLRAIVAADERLAPALARPGQDVFVAWATDRVPADNGMPAGAGALPQGAHVPGGASFRVVRYHPGRAGRLHRTATLDFGVVLAGSIVLMLEGGAETVLGAGDLLVQRGTIHNWINRGSEPCTIAFVILDALPIPVEPG